MFTRGSVAVVAAALVLAVGGCGSGSDEKADAPEQDSAGATTTPARPPSAELVRWVGDMCASTAALGNIRKDSAADLKEIRNPDRLGPTAELLAVGYLSRTPTAVEDVERDLAGLDPSGVPAADRLLDAWRKKLKRVVSALDELSPSAGFDDAEGSAAGVDRHVQSLTPPDPDLPALTKKDPRLAAAYRRAEQCAPGWQPAGETASPEATGPLPKAADGKNTDACSDGACEVLVTSTADITANGVDVHVAVSDDYVTFRTAGTLMQLGGAGGEAGFGDELKATVVAHNKDGAVLRFTTP
ncbi:hypothetical protein GTW38_06055 [Streptomyces sp. SID7804]|uniref:hypothetical protein n=1 Tax=Streptomyces TaxID=1883 RepID=UPI0013681116|nr:MULTISPECIES: hypothetical protein [Streptomyces]MBA8977158.1 hypothetical protein [Streptomyces calvus]MYS26509.1 hypothetical protein [Streptomyces sp. SID7804]